MVSILVLALAVTGCGEEPSAGGGSGDAAATTSAADTTDTSAATTTTVRDTTATPTDTTATPGDTTTSGPAYTFDLTPDDFVAGIDNPLLPLTPGSRWVYESVGEDEVERTEVVVTGRTREVMGITATVVRDTVTVDGELVEDTFDWFAQDTEGNVWYLGEESKEYEDGQVVSTAGSWEAGVDGALPGIIMEADPQVGDRYRQEYYVGEAEDMAEVVRTGESATVPHGAFDDLVVIREWNPLEPGTAEEKHYAAGVGLVLEVMVQGGEGRVELVEYEPGN